MNEIEHLNNEMDIIGTIDLFLKTRYYYFTEHE